MASPQRTVSPDKRRKMHSQSAKTVSDTDEVQRTSRMCDSSGFYRNRRNSQHVVHWRKDTWLACAATHDAAAWLHCCFRMIWFHVCICADMLNNLCFVSLSRICILSLCCEVIFSHCSICEMSLGVCVTRGAETRCTEKLPKTALYQATSEDGSKMSHSETTAQMAIAASRCAGPIRDWK